MGFREARKNAGKTVAEVMEYMKVTDASVYQWESGFTYPKPSRLQKLAAYYGCTVDELLRDNPKR